MPQRPDMLYPAGSVLMHPTLKLDRSRMYGFFVAGDLDRLQASVDATLTAVAGRHDFDWNALYAPGYGEGVQRFEAQYWRANVDPSERYVQSVVGSSRWRLATDGSGFGNLYLTGDWIRTGLNAGCVEAAVMAGMQTSRALCGHPAVIAGERDG